MYTTCNKTPSFMLVSLDNIRSEVISVSHLCEAVHLNLQMNQFTRMKASYQRALECLLRSFSSVWCIVAYLCTCYKHLYPTSHRDVYRTIIAVNFYTSFAISTINRTYFYNYGFLTQFYFADKKIQTFFNFHCKCSVLLMFWHCTVCTVVLTFSKVHFVMCSFLIPQMIWLVQERFSIIFPIKQYPPPTTPRQQFIWG